MRPETERVDSAGRARLRALFGRRWPSPGPPPEADRPVGPSAGPEVSTVRALRARLNLDLFRRADRAESGGLRP